MSHKEKAIELAMKFDKLGETDNAKKCAVITGDEILIAVESDWGFMQVRKEYWQEVKQEIQEL
ncbi:hypothetical protein [uncultured phage]|nr:hypothetical protein [uncultured phage]CAD8327853.1 hypothetical protein [uncultured phage]